MKKKNITKKELSETLSRQVQEYYHMEDRIDDLKAKLTFLSPEESEKLREQMRKEKYYSFQKKKFVPVAILSSLLLVGGSIGLTSLINQNMVDNNLIFFDEGAKNAEEYFSKYYMNYLCELNTSFKINRDTIINTYKLDNNAEKLCALQIYTTDKNPNIKVDLLCNEYTKFITYSEDNQISILNDTVFLLNEGDLITGSVYINDSLNRKIAFYF